MNLAGGIPPGLEDPAEQFELLFARAPYGVVYLDESARILACNPVAEAIIGVSFPDAEGLSSFDPRWRAIHEDGSPFPPETHPAAECLRTGQPVRGAVMGIWNQAEGRYRWASLDAMPQFRAASTRPWRAIVWIADITDRVLAGRAEERSQSMFRSLFSNMSEGVALHEMVAGEDGTYVDYRIVEVNPTYESHVGISRERAVGRLGSEVYGVSPAPYLGEFGGVASSGLPYHFETYFPPLDKHFIISVAPIGPEGFATIFFDISEAKRAGAERDHLLAELERKNQELESIVYVSSHDLRSPLVNIQGFGTRLEKDCAELAALAKAPTRDEALVDALALERIPRSLEFIRASGIKMDRLIAGLLRLSRTGRAALFPESLDMGRILGEIAAAMAFQVERTGASLVIGNLPPCFGDGEQVAQVFSNLLDNAVKYRSKDRPLRIVVSGEPKGAQVEYSVADTGIGVAPEHLEKIWELFYRLDPGDGAGGEGLGLSLVRRIVDRHKGSIRVESELGSGSRFIVTLPAAPGEGKRK